VAVVIVLRLPYPPSNNSYWRRPTKGPLAGRVLISEEGRAYREAVLQLVDDYKLPDRLRVEIEATMPDRRRRDLDNLPKAVLDALTHAQVWGDDNQIDDLRIYRAPEIAAPGHLWVRIWPMGAPVAEPVQADLVGAEA
jgi:crossover junction endodeoxyribonuclease RusA